jgi:nucleoside-diphosphate-sugar epimerase
MKRVLVTGGSGKAGRACVRELLEHGYEVINVDAARPGEALCPYVEADLADFGQALEALSGVDSRHSRGDAVVHLAAIPAPGRHTNAVTFRNNILSTYNVFEAARKLEIRNLVWASSETVLACHLINLRPTHLWTRSILRARRLPTRCRSPLERKWLASSAAGILI